MALGALALLGFIAPSAAQAAGGCGLGSPEICIAMIFVWIFQTLTALMGFILIMEVDALIRVAGYFNFVSPGPTAVRVGWIVTRDLANMAFIVFLMIIAFSTAIGYSKYHYEKTLSKLLIMAVVINFSKTLVGIMIDISQVVMLSFVNGFRAAAAGNFMNAFQINKLLALGDGQSEYTFGLVLAMMLAFILAAIAVSVVLIMLVMLVFRVVMLWVLIIFAPLAFLTAAFPLSVSYYSEWWGQLKKYLIGGPTVAFFLWLALATAQATSGNLSSPQEGWGVQSTASAQELQGQTTKAQIPSQAGRTDTILSMVIICCILFAGLKTATEEKTSGLASGIAGKIKSKTMSALRASTYGLAGGLVGGVAGYGLNRAKESAMTGFGKSLARMPLVGGAGRYLAMKGEGMKKARIASREKLFGSPEEMARLSPGAFVNRMSSLSNANKLDDIDKKRLDSMLGIALKNPSLAKDLGKSGAGHAALDQLIQQSKGKGLQDVVGTAFSDKNANSWMKGDPDLLKRTYDKLRSEWKDKDGNVIDPNMAKTVGEFEQKFAVQLQKNGLFGNDPSVVKEKLKEVVAKISTDDFKDVAGSDIGMFMESMTGKQFRDLTTDGKADQKAGMSEQLGKMSQKDALAFMRDKGVNATDIPTSWYSKKDGDGKTQFNDNVADFVLASTAGKAEARAKVMEDPARAEALRNAAKRALNNPLASKGKDKRAAAVVQAVTIGALKASDLDPDTLDLIVSDGDLAALARGTDKDDSGQVEAARKIFNTLLAKDPDRVRNLSKNDLYSKLLPSKAEIDAVFKTRATETAQKSASAKASVRSGLADEAGEVVKELSAQIQALKESIASDKAASLPVDTKGQQQKQLEGALGEIKQVLEKRQKAEQELKRETERLAQARASGSDTTGLERAVEALKKGVDDIETLQAKHVAFIKGIKIDEGGGGGRKNRGGGGGGSV
jgi:hypothetical protein